MGHRALVAVENAEERVDTDGRADTGGRYDLYYAHEGAHEWRLATAVDADALRSGRAALSGTANVDPAPVATDCAFETVVDDHVDFQQYEALYRVPRTGPVEPFLVCWFGLPGVDAVGPRTGALVAVDPARPLADGEFLRGWFAGASGLALVLVDGGVLGAGAVPGLLAAHLRSWASDRELHVSGAPDATGTTAWESER